MKVEPHTRRHAISGILAAVIFFAMLFTAGLSFIVFTFTSYNSYDQAQAAAIQTAQAKSAESLQLKSCDSSSSILPDNTPYTSTNPASYPCNTPTGPVASGDIGIWVQNSGSASVTLQDMWILDSTQNALVVTPSPVPPTNHSLPYTLNSGEGAVIDTEYCPPGYSHCAAGANDSYVITFLTSLGNEFSATYPTGVSSSTQVPTLTTTLSQNIVPVGKNVSDTATLSGVTPGTGGTISFYYSNSSACHTGATFVSSVTVTGNGNGNYLSGSHAFSTARVYYWYAKYVVGANQPVYSPCEPLVVSSSGTVTLTTTLSQNVIAEGQTTPALYDVATLTGISVGSSGTITFYNSTTTGTCMAPVKGNNTIGSVPASGDGNYPSGAAPTYTHVGLFYWYAAYTSGTDPPVYSPCEPLQVQTTALTLIPVIINTQVSSVVIAAGSSDYDTAAFSPSSFAGSGSLLFAVYSSSSCSIGSAYGSVGVVVGGSPGPWQSPPMTFNTAGTYYWKVSYSGDSIYASYTTPCGTLAANEVTTVAKATPTISTSLTPSSPIKAGGSVTDAATLSGFSGSNVGGTVTFYYSTTNTCPISGATQVGSPVSVSSGGSASSASRNFTTAGTYYWYAVYSGDGINNNGATSPCETLTVSKATPTISTSLTPSSPIKAGGSVTDAATLSGFSGSNVGGTVTFYYSTTNTCPISGATQVGSPVSVSSGGSASSASRNFTTAGTYYWYAVYSGDSNNNRATSPCEPLTVNKGSPTITTTLSSGGSISAGGAVTDSATLSGMSGTNAGGTVTYSFFNGATCSGSAITNPTVANGLIVTVANEVVPTSPSETFDSAGTFSWNAVYSGDTNNNGATSPCEPLTVNKANPSITTTLLGGGLTYAGGAVTDSATLFDASGTNAGGTVTYSFFNGATCSGSAITPPTVANGLIVTVANGVVPTSASETFSNAGKYSWDAIYSGDLNNAAATSPCEPMSVSTSPSCIPTPTNFCLATTSEGLGSLSFDFNSFNWYSSGLCAPQGSSSPLAVIGQTPKSSCTLTDGLGGGFGTSGIANAPRAYTISQTGMSNTKTNLLFSITVTNADPQGRTIVMDQFTQIWFSWFCPEVIGANGPCAPGPHGQLTSTYYGIVMVCAPGTIIWNAATGNCFPGTCLAGAASVGVTCTTTPGITLTGLNSTTGAPGQSTTVFFGLQDSDGGALPGIPLCGFVGSVPYPSQITPSFIFFHGTVGGLQWGQDFPLASTLWTNIGSCGSSANSPTISTALSSTNVPPGQKVTDTAQLSGATTTAGGTVTYVYYPSGTCTGASKEVGSAVTVTNGNVPTSNPLPFNRTGSYSWQAFYSGDSNNIGATSPCEPLTVALASLTISPTTGLPGASTTLTGSGFAHGTLYADCLSTSASVACVSGSVSSFTTTSGGNTPTSPAPMVKVPSGTSPGDYYVIVYSGTTVSALADYTVINPAIILTPNTGPVGTSVTVTGSGFSVNTPISTFTFNGAQPGTQTCTAQTTRADGSFSCTFTVPSSSLGSKTVIASGSDIGTIPADTASATFQVTTATTTAVYCVANPVTVGIGTLCTGTVSGNSASVVGDAISFFSSGSGSFVTNQCTIMSGTSCSVTYTPSSATGSPQTITAVFSGDTVDASSSGTTSLTVNAVTPTLSTTVSSSGTITIGGSATDTGTFSNGYGTLTGTLVFSAYTSSSCSGTASFTDAAITVSGNGPYTSGAFTPTSAGTYYWKAAFTDTDGSNNGVTTCGGTGETLTVSQATPSLTTSATTPLALGATSASDTATLTGAYAPTGTVTITLYTTDNSGTCSGVVGTATSSTWTPSGSSYTAKGTLTHTFSTAGSFYWVATFSGDTNNAAAGPTACGATGETLTVNLATPSLTTSATTPMPPGVPSASDTATLTGAYAPTGTVTFTLYTTDNSGTCSGVVGTATSSTWTSNGGGSYSATGTLTHTFSAAGSFYWVASFGGDTDNAAAGSNCGATGETFTVSLATPTLTTLATTPVASGATSASDTAYLTGAYLPTGTVTFTLYTTDTSGTCSGVVGTTTSSTWTSIGGTSYTATGTLTHAFSAAGFSYYWVATFSGDTDNAAVGPTPCGAIGETLTVSQLTPTLSTVATTPLALGATSAVDTATLTGAYSPTGTVTFNLYASNLCGASIGSTISTTWTSNGGGSYSATGTLTHTFTTAGSYYWVATFSGDTSNAAASTNCGAAQETLTVSQATPSIATLATTPLALGATSASDTATLTGAYAPTGTVTFTLYTTDTSGTCSGVVGTATSSTWTPSGSSYTATGMLTHTFSTAGSFYWVASFGGDANNAPAATTCGATGETLVVSQATPSIATSATTPLALGATSASDTATLTGAYSPTGTVTFTFYGPSASPSCVSGDLVGSTTSSSWTPSGSQYTAGGTLTHTFTAGGSYYWVASFGGDTNNAVATTSCGATGETLTITKASPTLTTTVSSSGSISIGGSATDQGTFSSGYGTLTGSLVFYAYTSSGCSTGLSFTSNTITVSGNGPYTSNSFSPAAGTYYWQAVFTDTDGNNNGFTTACGGTGETLMVKASPTLSTTVSSSGTITIGSLATDQGTFSNGYGTLTGSLVFYAYTSSSCSGGASFTSTTIPVSGNGPYTSSSFTPSAGTYYWQAVFTDTDGNNNGFTTACGGTGETLTVTKASPTLSTTVSGSGTITIGGSATDQGTFSSGYGTLTGSLVFYAYTSSGCSTGLSFTSNTITVSGNGPYTSNSFSPAAGTYYWQAVFTDTDGNNNGFTTACGGTGETLTVTKVSPTIATTLSSSSIVEGAYVTDSSSLSGATSTAGGTVQYEYFSGSACGGTATNVGSAVTVTNAVVPTSIQQTFSTKGSYSWKAVYSGDTNNNGATSSCETLNVAFLASPLDPNSASHGTTQAGSVTTATLTISTNNPNDLIYACEFTVNTGLTLGISDSAGLSWGTPRGSIPVGNNGGELQCWSAISSSALSGDVITVTSNTASGDTDVLAFAVSGVNTATPFDPNLAAAVTNSGSNKNPTCSLTTTNANDMIVGITVLVDHGEGINYNSGYSSTFATSTTTPSAYGEYEVVSATNTYPQTTSVASKSAWIMLCDAIDPIVSGSSTGAAVAPAAQSSLATNSMSEVHRMATTNSLAGIGHYALIASTVAVSSFLVVPPALKATRSTRQRTRTDRNCIKVEA